VATRLAVVGGRGWLGQAITHAARRRGLDALALARTPGPPGLPAVDPTDPCALRRALAGCDVVVNAAGDVTNASDDANVALPERLAAWAAATGGALVHLGSAAEYGPGAAGPGPVAESHPALPASPYGASKLAGTEAVLAQRAVGARVLVARVFNVLDADLPAANPISDLADQVRRAATDSSGGTTCEVVVGDPATVRDLAPRPWVADAVVALALAPTWPDDGLVNVCTGVGTAFGDLARAFGRHRGLDVAVRDLGWRRSGRIVGDPRRLQAVAAVPPTPSIDDLAAAVLGGPVPTFTSSGAQR